MIINNEELQTATQEVDLVLDKHEIHEKILILNTLRTKYGNQLQKLKADDFVNTNPLIKFANKLTKGMRDKEEQ